MLSRLLSPNARSDRSPGGGLVRLGQTAHCARVVFGFQVIPDNPTASRAFVNLHSLRLWRGGFRATIWGAGAGEDRRPRRSGSRCR